MLTKSLWHENPVEVKKDKEKAVQLKLLRVACSYNDDDSLIMFSPPVTHRFFFFFASKALS